MLLSYFVYVYMYTCSRVKKMGGIKVAVLENDFAGLSELGLPVSLCLHLQEKLERLFGMQRLPEPVPLKSVLAC